MFLECGAKDSDRLSEAQYMLFEREVDTMLPMGPWRAGLLVTGTFLMFRSAASANLITNGDFSSGLSGFITDYRYVAPTSQFSCHVETTFSIVASPNVCHDLWANFGDHSTGHGNMMVVNGANQPWG
jgi:hypothetical protein